MKYLIDANLLCECAIGRKTLSLASEPDSNGDVEEGFQDAWDRSL